MANLPWRVSVRLMALAKKIGMVVGIVLIVLLAVRVYLSQQGPELHPWHTWRADEMSVRELDNAIQRAVLPVCARYRITPTHFMQAVFMCAGMIM